MKKTVRAWAGQFLCWLGLHSTMISTLFIPGSILAAIRLLEAAGSLTAGDRAWLGAMVDQNINEYEPVCVSVCPGKQKKDRFRALLSALPDKPEGGDE